MRWPPYKAANGYLCLPMKAHLLKPTNLSAIDRVLLRLCGQNSACPMARIK